MSANLQDGEICGFTVDPVLKEVYHQNGKMFESCIQKDGSEKDIHTVQKRNVDYIETVEVCETSHEDQRKNIPGQTGLPAKKENFIALELEKVFLREGNREEVRSDAQQYPSIIGVTLIQ